MFGVSDQSESEVASSTIYPKVTSETFDEWVVREVTDFERIKGLNFETVLGRWRATTWASTEA